MAQVVEFPEQRKGKDRSGLYPGSVVVVQGTVLGAAVPGLVARVYGDEERATGGGGEMVAYPGERPFVDVMVIHRRPSEDPEVEGEVEVLHIRKLAWSGDVERLGGMGGSPGGGLARSPRYVVVSELKGE